MLTLMYIIIVTSSTKRGLIADSNSTYLESHSLTCEFSTTLKFGPNISQTYLYYLVQYEGDSLETWGDMIHRSWEFGKAIRPPFTEPVTIMSRITKVNHANSLNIAKKNSY